MNYAHALHVKYHTDTVTGPLRHLAHDCVEMLLARSFLLLLQVIIIRALAFVALTLAIAQSKRVSFSLCVLSMYCRVASSGSVIHRKRSIQTILGSTCKCGSVEGSASREIHAALRRLPGDVLIPSQQ